MEIKEFGMKNKNFWLGMLVLVFGMVVVGCGARGIEGIWVPEDGQIVSNDFAERKLELQKDETGIADGYSLKWTAEKGRLTLKFDLGFAYAYDYKLSGATLTLTSEGESVRYKKQ